MMIRLKDEQRKEKKSDENREKIHRQDHPDLVYLVPYLAAPGEDIVSEGMFGLDVMGSGTSMAAPHISGIAAVLWGKDTEKPAGFILCHKR